MKTAVLSATRGYQLLSTKFLKMFNSFCITLYKTNRQSHLTLATCNYHYLIFQRKLLLIANRIEKNPETIKSNVFLIRDRKRI